MPENFTPDGDGANSFDEFLARYLAGERARNARSIDISRFLSRRTQEILAEAGRFALQHGWEKIAERILSNQVPIDEAPSILPKIDNLSNCL